VCSAAACSAGCFIGGAFQAAGAVDPANSCQRCQPATSTTAYTPFADGTSCGGGKVCQSNACVSPDVGPCAPHAFRCGPDGSLETCNHSGTAWLEVATCTDGCSSGVCGPMGPCTPGARRCNGGNAEACSADGTTWVLDQVCTTYCAGAGICALDGLLVTSVTNLDGTVYVQGQARVFSGGTLASPAGDLTLYADTIVVDQGGTIAVAPTGQSPQGTPPDVTTSVFNCAAGFPPLFYYGGGYGTQGHPVPPISNPGGGAIWGSTTDSDVEPGSPGSGGLFDPDVPRITSHVPGGGGGGVLRLVATASINVAGQLAANGANGVPVANGCGGQTGGGSGGGVLVAAEAVTISGSVSAAGGLSPATPGNPSNEEGGGGLGRVKILARTGSVTGTVTGVLNQALEPPLVIASTSHPDPTLAYNDSAAALLVGWARPFPSLQGYYVRLDTATGPPPTAANGTFVAAEATTFPASALSPGNNYFHIVSVDAQSNAGAIETRFHVLVNASPPGLSSPSHPDQSAWSANATPTFAWTFPQGDPSVAGANYLVDQSGLTVPDGTAAFLPTSQKQIVLPALQPGVSVFHIVSVDTQGNRTRAAAHYRINIGTNPGTGAIVGTVVDGSGAPVNGAVVSVNNGLYSQATNSAGQYNLNTVTAGTWQVTVTSGGRSSTRAVTVTSGGVSSANFTL
jgi:hypothetical protein